MNAISILHVYFTISIHTLSKQSIPKYCPTTTLICKAVMEFNNRLQQFLRRLRLSADLMTLLATLLDTLLSLYFMSCNMFPCTIDLDDNNADNQTTTVHFWMTGHRKESRPSIVLIHGFGGNSRWQFYNQVGHLSKHFNVYIPDLLYFGKSYSSGSDRSIEFQADCIGRGLRKLGLERYSIVGLSYGGYVGYRMAAELYEVEKVVIISSGICQSKQQMEEQLKKLGDDDKIEELLVPQKPEDVRKMVKLAMYKSTRFHFTPDFLLAGFIKAINNKNREEKLELVDHLLKKRDSKPPVITQETLLIWGEQDQVFPLHLAYQLQRHLGPNARLEVLKETGHGANIDSPEEVNRLITSFVSQVNLN
ncbi:Monoacylglycerol lipase ABHD6 [Linum grandiflorum]